MQRKYNTNPKASERRIAHKFQPQPFVPKKAKAPMPVVSTTVMLKSLLPTTASFNVSELTESLGFLSNSLQLAIPDTRGFNNRLFLFYFLSLQLTVALAATECKRDQLHGQFEEACKVLAINLIDVFHYSGYQVTHYPVATCHYDISCKTDKNEEQLFHFKDANPPAANFDMHYEGGRLFYRVKCGMTFPQGCGGITHYEYDVPPAAKPY